MFWPTAAPGDMADTGRGVLGSPARCTQLGPAATQNAGDPPIAKANRGRHVSGSGGGGGQRRAQSCAAAAGSAAAVDHTAHAFTAARVQTGMRRRMCACHAVTCGACGASAFGQVFVFCAAGTAARALSLRVRRSPRLRRRCCVGGAAAAAAAAIAAVAVARLQMPVSATGIIGHALAPHLGGCLRARALCWDAAARRDRSAQCRRHGRANCSRHRLAAAASAAARCVFFFFSSSRVSGWCARRVCSGCLTRTAAGARRVRRRAMPCAGRTTNAGQPASGALTP